MEFCSELEFFKGFAAQTLPEGESESVIGLFENCSLEGFAAWKVVYKQWDKVKNKKCYVVLKGCVELYIPNEYSIQKQRSPIRQTRSSMNGLDENRIKIDFLNPSNISKPENQQSLTPQLEEKSKGSREDELSFFEEATDALNQPHISSRDGSVSGVPSISQNRQRAHIYGERVSKIKVGGIFGMNEYLSEEPRAHTAVCVENTELMVFHKADLDRVRKYFSPEFTERIALVSKLVPELYSVTNRLRVANVVEHFSPFFAFHGETIFNEGEKNTKVYFLYEGIIELHKNIPIVSIDKAKKLKEEEKEMNLTVLQAPCIIGEEIIARKNEGYLSKAVVQSASVKGLVLQKHHYFDNPQVFPLYEYLERSANMKA